MLYKNVDIWIALIQKEKKILEIILILLNNRALQVDLATPSEHRSSLTIIQL